jgi:glycosyltransferase involved in cell wall biosynthesis
MTRSESEDTGKDFNSSRIARSLQEADAARDRGEWLLAAQKYELVLERDSLNAKIWVQFGNMNKEAGRYETAAAAYMRAAKLDPKDADVQLQFGHLKKRQGNSTSAISHYVHALKLDSQCWNAFHELELLGASHIAEKIFGLGSSSSLRPSTIIFDVSDLVYYLGHHDNPTGIQRVQCSIVLAIIKNSIVDKDRIQFVSYDQITQNFRLLNKDAFINLLEELPLPPELRTIVFDKIHAKQGVLFPAGPISAAIAQGRTVLVLLGAAWVVPDYSNVIANLKRKYGIRFVMTFHDFIPIYARETCDQGTADIFKVFVDQIIDHVDLALCVSESTERDLIRYCDENNFLKPASVVTQNGSSFSEFFPLNTVTSIDDFSISAPFVLFVSTIEGRKNHDYVFRIWNNLVKAGVDVPKLVCVGRLGWRSEAFLQALISTNWLDGRVEILEDVSDSQLTRLYEKCQFTIYPSIYEGWGLPVGESLANGKICVLSRNSSLPEVAGDFGVYIPLSDLEAACKIIRNLLEDSDQLLSLEQKIVDQYIPITWQAVAERVIEGCEKSLRDAPKSSVPLIEFGAEYPVRSLRINSFGTMGQAMMDTIERAHALNILDGKATPHARIVGLAVRDDCWYAPEDWGCWSKGLNAGLQCGLDLEQISHNSDVILYAALSFPSAHLPGSIELRVGKVGIGIKKVRSPEHLLQWRVPILLIKKIQETHEKERLRINLFFTLKSSGDQSLGNADSEDKRQIGFGIRSFIFIQSSDLERRLEISERVTFGNGR